ncbi:MAG: MetQ/NlpA family ABC transporter substrate-binding protein [Beduini sp.]|uniref:MetQ/NlpA family ABC transporter substrate-binding protein n=1 Tax=Beduini sp. TaxID=1922300 RepID=UPI0039A0BC88
MKKLTTLLFTALLFITLVGCANKNSGSANTLIVSATSDPHSRILEAAKPILKEKYDIDLKIKVLDDYYIFNKALDNGEVDANYFQHLPFFEEELATHQYDLVNAGGIHIEPFGIYSKKYSKLEDIPNGAAVIISNSVADNGRILAILADAGLIKIPEGKNIFDLTISEIQNNKDYNPKALKFNEIKPELLVTTFNSNEGDLVAINGNYAIQGGLNPSQDALILESASQDNPYVNIVATTKTLQNDDRILALVEVLQSDEIKQFIENTYSNGSVIPAETN